MKDTAVGKTVERCFERRRECEFCARTSKFERNEYDE